jgi:hypothetical protein
MDNIGYIHRAYNPRINHYESDGLGRDGYISCNNGGFYTNIVTNTENRMYDKRASRAYHSLRKNVAPLKYRSDGSGRDGYILHEHGGLERDYKPLKEYHPKDFLRTPSSCIYKFKSNLKSNGSMAKTVYVSKEELNFNNTIKNMEKRLINRLYWSEKPKFTRNVKINCQRKETAKNYGYDFNINTNSYDNKVIKTENPMSRSQMNFCKIIKTPPHV